MTRLLRWQYLLPQAVLLVVVILAAQYALSRYVRSAVIGAGQAVTGAQVELGGARVALARAEVLLHDLRIANASEPTQTLLQAEGCTLNVPTGALLHKCVTIERGEMVGLRLRQPREMDGMPTTAPTAMPAVAWFEDRTAELAEVWLENVQKQFERDLIHRFESVRLANELAARWPQQSAELRDRVWQLKRKTAKLEADVHNAQANSLRHAKFLDNLPNEVVALRSETDKLTAELEKLPDLVESDRRAILAARRHDEQMLREALDVGPIDGAMLTAYLLRDEVAGPAGELIGWLRWTRQVLPDEAPVQQNGQRNRCDFLVQSLAMHGTAWVGGKPLELAGTIADLTSDPAGVGRPLRLSMATGGSLPLVVTATIDRTQAVAKDEFSAQCENVSLPEIELGRADKLHVSLAPSVASMTIHAAVNGQDLSGTMRLVQKQVRVSPSVGANLERVHFGNALKESLCEANSVTTELTFTGTLDQPRWAVRSDLGLAMAAAMQIALARAAERRADELLAQSQRHIDEQLARLDRQIADEQTALLSQLAGSTRLLEQVAQQQRPAERLTPDQLGRRVPAGSLFR